MNEDGTIVLDFHFGAAFGLLAYLALIGTVFVCAGSLSNRSPDRLRARYGEAVICITTAYIIASFGLDFTHNMGYLNQLYYALLGVLSGSMDVMASAKIAADRAILAGEYSAAV